MSSHKKTTPVKIILLGDSAVGKTKLVERFLMEDYKPITQSTYALTLFPYKANVNNEIIDVDFWDSAGQERFNNVHPSYYFQAHACIFVFDTTRKITYKNLEKWYTELQTYRKGIPCICVGNKIDYDPSVTTKSFSFAEKRNMPFFFTSAAEGTNVVQIFTEAIKLGKQHRDNPSQSDTFIDDVLDLLGDS